MTSLRERFRKCASNSSLSPASLFPPTYCTHLPKPNSNMLRSALPTLRTSVLARRTFVSTSIARESPLDTVKQTAEKVNKVAGDAAAKGEPRRAALCSGAIARSG